MQVEIPGHQPAPSLPRRGAWLRRVLDQFQVARNPGSLQGRASAPNVVRRVRSGKVSVGENFRGIVQPVWFAARETRLRSRGRLRRLDNPRRDRIAPPAGETNPPHLDPPPRKSARENPSRGPPSPSSRRPPSGSQSRAAAQQRPRRSRYTPPSPPGSSHTPRTTTAGSC